MSRWVSWLQHRETKLFYMVNGRIRHRLLDGMMGGVTHLGGAAFTISASLLVALFADGALGRAGWESFLALAVSHVPVALVKRAYPRRRPYLVLPEAKTGKHPLTDHSFPSGHSTAIFSVVVPFVAAVPALGCVLLPVAALVSLSRIYLGLHYPSDCAAGIALGSLAGVLSVAFLG